MSLDEEYYYMNYLREKYGEEKARDFYVKAREAQNAPTPTNKNNTGGYKGIPLVAKGITNGSMWKHDGYRVVVEVTDENAAKGGVTFRYVEGGKYYPQEMIDEFKKVGSFSGFGKLLGHPKAALEHSSWHCIQSGTPSNRTNKGYVAKPGDTIRTTYNRNGYKAS